MPTPVSPDIQKLDHLLSSTEKKIAMLAPSFVVDFEYPKIITILRHLGFDKVVETTFGAKIVNECYKEFLSKNQSKSYISSPCPTLVALVENKYPQYKENLMPFVSPMVAMGKVLKTHFPGYKVVFIGPCLTKKLEAKKFPQVIDVVITFSELQQYLNNKNLQNIVSNPEEKFDSLSTEATKIYPLDGGMTESMPVDDLGFKDKIKIVNGLQNELKLLNNFATESQKFRFFDCLSCPGGCIGGPGVISKEPTQTKIQKVRNYLYQTTKEKDKWEEGKSEDTTGISFESNFN